MWAKPVSLINGVIVADAGVARSVRFASRVLGFDEPPRRGDTVVDLEGAAVLPGLVNAHDHLELNHYGRLKRRERYANAREWIDDLRPALRDDPGIGANRGYALADRLFIGGLKNLLSGVTTVAHHNPLYREIRWHVPVRVVRRFGWAHSFALEGLPVGANGERGGSVEARYRATDPNRPFVVHAGEGVDAEAVRELEQLDELGCVGGNTVVVHGVAMTARLWKAYVERRAGVIWCPASNQFLFGQTLPVRALIDGQSGGIDHLCLATDSRVTGSRDLLAELALARTLAALSPGELLKMVTSTPAKLLRLDAAGRLAENRPADLIVLRGPHTANPSLETIADALLAAERRDLAMVVLGGRPVIGSPGFLPAFMSRRVASRPVSIDGAVKVMAASLARRLAASSIAEPGVVLQ